MVAEFRQGIFNALSLGGDAAEGHLVDGVDGSEDTNIFMLLSCHLDDEYFRGSQHEAAHQRSSEESSEESRFHHALCSNAQGTKLCTSQLHCSQAPTDTLDIPALLERCGEDADLVAAVMESFCSQVNTEPACFAHVVLRETHYYTGCAL